MTAPEPEPPSLLRVALEALVPAAILAVILGMTMLAKKTGFRL